jgi:hypothetical protein
MTLLECLIPLIPLIPMFKKRELYNTQLTVPLYMPESKPIGPVTIMALLIGSTKIRCIKKSGRKPKQQSGTKHLLLFICDEIARDKGKVPKKARKVF